VRKAVTAAKTVTNVTVVTNFFDLVTSSRVTLVTIRLG
jgi:hypothetical protein